MLESFESFSQREQEHLEHLEGTAKRLQELADELDEVFRPRQYLRADQQPPNLDVALIELRNRAEECAHELRQHAAEDVRFERQQEAFTLASRELQETAKNFAYKRTSLDEADLAAWEAAKRQFLAAVDGIRLLYEGGEVPEPNPN